MKSNFLSGLLMINLACVSGCFEPVSVDMENPDPAQVPANLQFAGPLTFPSEPSCSSANQVWTWQQDAGTLTSDIQKGNPSETCADGKKTATLTCAAELPAFPLRLASANRWELRFDRVWTWLVPTGSQRDVESRLDSVEIFPTTATGEPIAGVSHASSVLRGQASFTALQLSSPAPPVSKEVRFPIEASAVRSVDHTGQAMMGRVRIVLHTACAVAGGSSPPAPAKLELKNIRLIPITP